MMFLIGSVEYNGVIYDECIIFGMLANVWAFCFTPKGERLSVEWNKVIRAKKIKSFDINFSDITEIEILFEIEKEIINDRLHRTK